MTADVVKDRRPRQGTSQDILKGGRGGGRVTMSKREGTYQIALSTSKPCFTQCDKKRLKNGGGGGEVTGIPELPPSLPLASYVLVSGSQEAESNSLLVFPSFTITA